MISFKNAQIGYPTRTISILDGIDLPAHGIVCIIGKNGVGKTTLFKTLTRELRLLSGNIMYDETSLGTIRVDKLALQQCFIPQNIHSNVNMYVKSWILLGRCPYYAYGACPSSADDYHVIKAAEQVGIEHMLLEPVHQLSGGELRRAAIARAIVQDATIWLLDEIYSQMDIDAAISMRKLLAKQAEDKLLIVSTHCLQTAYKTADFVLLLYPDGTADYAPPNKITNAMLSKVYGIPFENMSVQASTVDSGSWITH